MATTLPAGIVPITAEEARRLIRHTSGPELEALLARANAVRHAVHGAEVSLCGIVNAKSGHCPENCGFCSQSAHFDKATAPEYPLMTARQIAEQAKTAEKAGAREFSIVTSGTRVAKEEELRTIEAAVKLIREESGVEPCASLGLTSLPPRKPSRMPPQTLRPRPLPSRRQKPPSHPRPWRFKPPKKRSRTTKPR